MFDKIMIPLDNSEHSKRALLIAIEVAKKFNGKLTLFHVYSVSVPPVDGPESASLASTGMPVIDPSSIARAIDAAREAGREVLDEGVRTSEAYEVVAECLLREGNTVEEIAKLAKERNFELIVMGFGGASRIKELLFGNVSEGVAKHVSCPVLLVK